jgi:hypothetical protein
VVGVHKSKRVTATKGNNKDGERSCEQEKEEKEMIFVWLVDCMHDFIKQNIEEQLMQNIHSD